MANRWNLRIGACERSTGRFCRHWIWIIHYRSHLQIRVSVLWPERERYPVYRNSIFYRLCCRAVTQIHLFPLVVTCVYADICRAVGEVPSWKDEGDLFSSFCFNSSRGEVYIVPPFIGLSCRGLLPTISIYSIHSRCSQCDFCVVGDNCT